MRTHTVRGGNDVALHVREAGRGRPILFVHGFSQSLLSWRHQFESSLTDEFRLVAFDSRGHGESDKPRDAYDDSELWAQDVRAVITELGLDDVILVGWSYGGLVVLDYVDSFGTDRLTGVTLVGAISTIGTDTATERLGPEYLELVSGFVSTDVEESTATMRQFVDLCVFDDLDPDDHYFMLGYNVVVPPHVRDSLRDRTVSHDAELEALDVPVLLTHGTEDAVVLPEASEAYADRVADAELSWYPETGHTPFWEQPARFNRELRAFARETPPSE
ncbi:Pimeloyl-ACP methyl ester carboxylesterase [Halogranum gelatinilyticum]|uniref:Pimeloyl-ACP methyl ester carboxylesterase n=1 Tax=Halogranum gelatinilyticum TaxID=660521 RepID=A0A1G9ZSN9_9EURY|nr:alpha/beta hydrolase [Halogranum gelatinilyticum]SDN23911.1 Pimeloyl-ACP methyl ester carboxylesterase [Halogranum gelatinilyticum]